MIHLYTIEAWGVEPAAWKVPDVGVDRRGGKTHRFVRRSGKSNFAAGRVNMADWESLVQHAARQVVGKRQPEQGSVRLDFTFYAETPPGRRHGELWDVTVEYDARHRRYVKRQRFGHGEPDLTNLIKSTEDALKGVVVVDDCSCRPITALPLFGPVPGVRIEVYRVEPSDYPGEADTLVGDDEPC